MKNRIDLVRRALGLLGLVSAGQPVAPEDHELVNAEVDPLLAQLDAANVAYVSDADAIDEAVFLPLATVLACSTADDFGVATVRGMPVALARMQAESELRAQVREHFLEPVRFQNF